MTTHRTSPFRDSCRVSGTLVLETTDLSVFPTLHFIPVTLQAGSWTAVPFIQTTGLIPSSRQLRRQKAIPALLGAWVVSESDDNHDVHAFSMEFALDFPHAFFVDQGFYHNEKHWYGRSKKQGGVLGVELAAEIRVTRMGSADSVKVCNDLAWRQRDKMLWVWPVPKDRPSPRWMRSIFCYLY